MIMMIVVIPLARVEYEGPVSFYYFDSPTGILSGGGERKVIFDDGC